MKVQMRISIISYTKLEWIRNWVKVKIHFLNLQIILRELMDNNSLRIRLIDYNSKCLLNKSCLNQIIPDRESDILSRIYKLFYMLYIKYIQL